MKNLFLSAFLVFSILVLGCSSNKPKVENTTPKISTKTTQPQITPTPPSSSTQEKIFSASDLKKYNGQNGNPAYIAVDGIVYDVTNAPKWQNGIHQGVTAGNDLSEDIKSSPHGKDILKTIPVVGVYKK